MQQLLMTYKLLGVVVRCIFPTRPLCPPFPVALVIKWGHWNLISTFLPMNWKACGLYDISNELWRYVIWLEVNRYDNQTMSTSWLNTNTYYTTKSLKIPKMWSKSVYRRRTDNAMTKILIDVLLPFTWTVSEDCLWHSPLSSYRHWLLSNPCVYYLKNKLFWVHTQFCLGVYVSHPLVLCEMFYWPLLVFLDILFGYSWLNTNTYYTKKSFKIPKGW
jgi:hypothetical protein